MSDETVSKGAEADALEAVVEQQAARIDALESKLENQEQSLRHVLGMLIEWMEDDQEREAA